MTKRNLHKKETKQFNVTKFGKSAHIIVPFSLIGEKVDVIFNRKLTEEELKSLELSRVVRELKEIRKLRNKKFSPKKREEKGE